MITNLFDVEGTVVKPSIHCYVIPELKKIIDDHEDHIKILAYCFYMTCPYKSINPYSDICEEDREEILRKDFPILSDNLDVIAAIEKLNLLWETEQVGYFRDNKRNLEDIRYYIRTNMVSEDNIDKRLKIAEKCGKILMEYTTIEKAVEEERQAIKTRADRKIGKGELDSAKK